jgi:succinoglycan biosynthesis transport protein ExoP
MAFNEPMEPMQARAVALASRPTMTLGRRWQDLARDAEPQLADYLAVIRRQARMIIGLVLVAGAVAAAYLALATPKYQASVTLLIEPQLPKVLSTIQDLKATAALENFYNTQQDIIRSRSVAEAVIGKLGPDKVRLLVVPPVWQRWWPERWRQSPGSDDQKDQTEARLEAFRLALTVEGLKDSEVVTVGFDAVDPELAAEVASQVAGAYIELERNARSSLSKEANQWVAAQLEELRQKLAQSEAALHQFQVRKGLLDSQSLQTTNREKLSVVAKDLIEAQSKRALAEVRYQQAREIETRGGGYESLLGVIENAAVLALKNEEAKLARTVQELSVRHGESFPRLIAAKADLAENTRRLKVEIAVAVEAIRKEYEATLSHEQQLKKLSETLKSSLQNLTTKEYELTRLEREAAINRELFDMFLSRGKEIGVTSEFNATNIRIVDRAAPPREPYSPNPIRVFALAGLLSGFLGIVLAFLREHLDRGFNTPRDIEERLKMSALGLLLRVDRRSPAERQVILEPGSWFSDAIGDIRARLQRSAVQDPPKVVLITSSVPGEGKTTLASNLALSFSRSCRTLLVDADWRNAAGGYLAQRGKAKGFSNFAAGQSPLEECIVRDEETENLYIMTAGCAVTPGRAAQPPPDALAQEGRACQERERRGTRRSGHNETNDELAHRLLRDIEHGYGDGQRKGRARPKAAPTQAGSREGRVAPGRSIEERLRDDSRAREQLLGRPGGAEAGAGHLKVNPLEFLSSEMISIALKKLTDAFDRIIIDGPPAVAISDVILLGRRVDGVILVVKAGDTTYPMAQEVVQKLRATDIKLLGAVLSQVDIKKMMRYGGHRYHYGHSSGLQAGRER